MTKRDDIRQKCLNMGIEVVAAKATARLGEYKRDGTKRKMER